MPIEVESRIMNQESRMGKSENRTLLGFNRDSLIVILARTERISVRSGGRDFTQGGFTLIEMIVSIALFSFVMLATTTVLLSVVDANHKAQGLKTTINNLSLTLESIARNLRTGSSYVTVNSNDVCPFGGEDNIGYVDQYGSSVIYQQNGGTIQIIRGETISDMTASEITINRLCFYVVGQDPADQIQPKILITAGGIVNIASTAGAKMKTTSRFDLQTLVSQRLPDVPREIEL